MGSHIPSTAKACEQLQRSTVEFRFLSRKLLNIFPLYPHSQVVQQCGGTGRRGLRGRCSGGISLRDSASPVLLATCCISLGKIRWLHGSHNFVGEEGRSTLFTVTTFICGNISIESWHDDHLAKKAGTNHQSDLRPALRERGIRQLTFLFAVKIRSIDHCGPEWRAA